MQLLVLKCFDSYDENCKNVYKNIDYSTVEWVWIHRSDTETGNDYWR